MAPAAARDDVARRRVRHGAEPVVAEECALGPLVAPAARAAARAGRRRRIVIVSVDGVVPIGDGNRGVDGLERLLRLERVREVVRDDAWAPHGRYSSASAQESLCIASASRSSLRGGREQIARPDIGRSDVDEARGD